MLINDSIQTFTDVRQPSDTSIAERDIGLSAALPTFEYHDAARAHPTTLALNSANNPEVQHSRSCGADTRPTLRSSAATNVTGLPTKISDQAGDLHLLRSGGRI